LIKHIIITKFIMLHLNKWDRRE